MKYLSCRTGQAAAISPSLSLWSLASCAHRHSRRVFLSISPSSYTCACPCSHASNQPGTQNPSLPPPGTTGTRRLPLHSPKLRTVRAVGAPRHLTSPVSYPRAASITRSTLALNTGYPLISTSSQSYARLRSGLRVASAPPAAAPSRLNCPQVASSLYGCCRKAIGPSTLYREKHTRFFGRRPGFSTSPCAENIASDDGLI